MRPRSGPRCCGRPWPGPVSMSASVPPGKWAKAASPSPPCNPSPRRRRHRRRRAYATVINPRHTTPSPAPGPQTTRRPRHPRRLRLPRRRRQRQRHPSTAPGHTHQPPTHTHPTPRPTTWPTHPRLHWGEAPQPRPVARTHQMLEGGQDRDDAGLRRPAGPMGDAPQSPGSFPAALQALAGAYAGGSSPGQIAPEQIAPGRSDVHD